MFGSHIVESIRETFRGFELRDYVCLSAVRLGSVEMFISESFPLERWSLVKV